jgi:hypothetical protein
MCTQAAFCGEFRVDFSIPSFVLPLHVGRTRIGRSNNRTSSEAKMTYYAMR